MPSVRLGQGLVEQPHVLVGVEALVGRRLGVDPQHRVVADDLHHPVDALAGAVARAGCHVGGVVGADGDHPAAVETLFTQVLGGFDGVGSAVVALDRRARSGDVEAHVAGADALVLRLESIGLRGRKAPTSIPTEIESPMWAIAVHDVEARGAAPASCGTAPRPATRAATAVTVALALRPA